MEENYLSTTYTQFYIPTEVSDQFSYSETSDGKPDVIKSLFTDAGKGRKHSLLILSAQLPQEQGGIVVPPEMTSAPDTFDGGNDTDIESTEKAYKEYLDVVISEALVGNFRGIVILCNH